MAKMQDLPFFTDDRLAGFRLVRLEVFNWETFDGRAKGPAGPAGPFFFAMGERDLTTFVRSHMLEAFDVDSREDWSSFEYAPLCSTDCFA